MIKEIEPRDLPSNSMKIAYMYWKNHFKNAIETKNFVPYLDYQGEDKNMNALKSKEAFIEWFAQPPGDEPYRDDGFYVRELSWLSKWCNPKKVVEFGTDKGLGTFILSRLNPQASVDTTDIRHKVPMPDNSEKLAGFFAAQCSNVFQYNGDSSLLEFKDVDFCFIDGDHSQDAVWEDSLRAWGNRNKNGRWVIVWHDYREGHGFTGLKMAINRFSDLVRMRVYKFKDSSTVWMTSDA